MTESPRKVITDEFLVRFSIGAPIVMAIFSAALIFGKEFDLNTIYKFLDVTGRCMLTTFMFSFGASTAYYFLPNKMTGWVLRQRKYFGISFAVFLFIHFFGLFLKLIYDTPFFIKDTTIPEYLLGIIAIVFTTAMAITSTDKAQQELGFRKWSLLHTIGGNCILFGFWLTYLDHDLGQLPIFLLINCLIILRSIKRIQFIRKTKKLSILKIVSILIVVLTGSFIGMNSFKETKDMSAYAGLEFKARDYYPLYEGNSWTYRVEDSNHNIFVQKYEIRGTERVGDQETWKLYFSNEGYKCLAYDDTGVRKYKEFDEGRTEIYNPPCSIMPDLMFNVMKEFQSNYTEPFDSAKKNSEIKGDIVFKVSLLEDVTVKAGVFKDCLRIEYYDKWIEPDGSYDITTGTGWFAKHVGVVKESSQLINYDPQTEKTTIYQENAELIEASIEKW